MGEMEKRLKKVVAIVKGKYRGKDPILIVTHGVVIRLFLFMTGKKKTLGAAMAQNVRNGDIVRVRI